MRDLRLHLGLAACLLALGGCSDVDPAGARQFTATGQMIALSGGDAGANNACITCHGLSGEGNGAGAPRLAGIDQGYLAAQMRAYADGRREHPEMRFIASQLTLAQHQAVSAYYAALPYRVEPSGSPYPASAAALYHRGDAARGLASCASCHGDQGEGVGPGNPPLAGQPAAYVAEQIAQWRGSARRTDAGNVMLAISRRLSPAEATALGAYAATLPGGPPRPGSRAASLAGHRADPRNDASAPLRHGAE